MPNQLNVEKMIVLTVADYYFGLPIGEVLQVVNRPPTSHELSQAGCVQLGRHMIRLLDLHQWLEREDSVAKPCPFLVITQSLPGEFCAIPVSEPPNLIEFLRESIRELPQPNAQDSQSQSRVLRLASHAVMVDHDDRTASVFLLNLQRMFTAIAPLHST
jgi:purine-binding chemotaxis protein CheW